MNLEAEAPETKKKMKKKKKTKPSLPTSSSSSPSFSLIPDDITVNCLARISRMYYPPLSIVSKSFRSLVSSTELYTARSHLGNTEQCVYVCLWDESFQSPQWFTLWINPNKTLPDSITQKKKTTGQLLALTNSSNFLSVSRSVFVVGSEIYVIGGPLLDYEPSSAVQVLDCRSQTWRDAPSMSVARKNHLACIYDGKIYVLGGVGLGVEDKPWAEVFDIKTQTWGDLPVPDTEVHKFCLRGIAENQGKIHFRYYSEYSIKSYDYDPKQGKWESCNGQPVYPMSTCVIDGVSYMRDDMRRNHFDLHWSKGKYWKMVKGLDSLKDHYRRNGGSSNNSTTKLVTCGGKLYLIWEGYMNNKPNNRMKIWCAEIVVEKRDGGEVWGNVQWIDVVHSVPMSCEFLHCLVVSV